MLSVIPDSFDVDSISYSEEESWGFGPGGNEAGIRVYPFPEHIANEIAQRGIAFFNNLSLNNQTNKEWWQKRTWYQTPIVENEHWKIREQTKKLDIHDYICAYGFCININPTVVKDANEIINSKGSYYAYGRIGLIVVNPNKKLILYMYNG
ncbi:MAG: hypothetical protein WAX77_01895 [Methylococcaceae bacterium]